jgi:SSS family solute:Na+ symporter
MSVPVTVWFTWGGIHDIRALFRRLREEHVCHFDDGTVINHSNLDEAISAEKKISPQVQQEASIEP